MGERWQSRRGWQSSSRWRRETFLLWDQVRIGWSWRHYYLNHTLRVRALALELRKHEGADPDVVAFAATLHDISKAV